MTTPCGQPDPTACPGLTITLETHEHQAPPEGQRRSLGAKAHRRHAANSGFDAYDALTSNWCPTCQETLLRCSRAGCPKAEGTHYVYAYTAAQFALALARNKSDHAWTMGEEEFADNAVRTRALSRFNGPSSNPDTWHPDSHPTTSLINWFGYKMDKDIAVALGDAKTAAKRTARPDLPNDPDDPDDSDGWNHIPSHRRGPENAAVFYDENQRLSAQWQDLVDTILDELRPQRSHGAAPPPAMLMLYYLADFANNRTYTDKRYGIGRTSDRDIAYQLDIGNSAISRTRKEVLIPTCENLLGDPNLTDQQREALITVTNHLHSRPVREAPPAKPPKHPTPEAGTP